jgi:SRSO17 transposase
VAVGHSVNPAGWQITFDELTARIAGRFGRVEPRRTARAYLSALLSNIERKNCWHLAEQAGHLGPHAMRRLLRTTRWQADEVRDDLREYVIERLGHDGGV